MKALLRDYVASLRERGELDVMLPDLLSESGFTVLSRPGRGTTQKGVDISAIGPGVDGVRKLYLFSLKQGDLTRQDWSGTPQSLRSSLEEIQDAYLENRVLQRYRDMPVVICVVMGGDMLESVQENWVGFAKRHSRPDLEFECWNGDHLAGMLMQGYLREQVLPGSGKGHFQKAVAMADIPEVSLHHFSRFCRALLVSPGVDTTKGRMRAIRQVGAALSVLYVWCREVGNLDAAYRASERALLTTWELARPALDARPRERVRTFDVVARVADLHVEILVDYVTNRIVPNAGVLHGLTLEVASSEYADINLALFDALGRVAMCGLWFASRFTGEQPAARYDGAGEGEAAPDDPILAMARLCVHTGLTMIGNNPVLGLPVQDSQVTDIALFLLLCGKLNVSVAAIAPWLASMVSRLDFTVRSRNRYPVCSTDYQDLVDRPDDEPERYFQQATAGSTLIPLLALWSHACGLDDAYDVLLALVAEKLDHCSLQGWIPGPDSEAHLYRGDAEHGLAVVEGSISGGGNALRKAFDDACRHVPSFDSLSAVKVDAWPVVLLACRHFGFPLPVQCWMAGLPR